MKFGYNRLSTFRGEVIRNCERADDGRTDDGAAYTISSPGAIGFSELNKNKTVSNVIEKLAYTVCLTSIHVHTTPKICHHSNYDIALMSK